jgi:small subunit ribosomal protein S17
MEKTVVVAIDISKPHRIYKKVVRTTKKIYAHDESNAIPVGTIVRVVESRPLSKLKRWVVEAVVQDTGNKVVEKVSMEAQDEAEIEAIETYHEALQEAVASQETEALQEAEASQEAEADEAPDEDEESDE